MFPPAGGSLAGKALLRQRDIYAVHADPGSLTLDDVSDPPLAKYKVNIHHCVKLIL